MSAVACASSSGRRHRTQASIGAGERLWLDAVQPVQGVVPHQAVALDVPVPDAERGRVDRELDPVLAGAQLTSALLELALTALPRLDLADQIVERGLEPGGHVVERVGEGLQFFESAARHSCAQVAARHVLRGAGHPPERCGHHRREHGRQNQGQRQRQREHHGRAAAPLALPRQIELFGHGRDQDPVTAARGHGTRWRRSATFPVISGFSVTWSKRNSVASVARHAPFVCSSRAITALPTTGSPSDADDATVAQVLSRMKTRPFESE